MTRTNGHIPVHVAIIPDGNRRWAKSKGLVASEGHRRAGSYEHIKSLFDEAKELGVKYLSFWAFSTENWARDKKETDAIFEMIGGAVKKWRKDAVENEIRFRHIGRRDRLPKELVSELEKLEQETKKFDKIHINLCLDYGGRDEIIRAIDKMIKDGVEKADEKIISEYLDTKDIPDVDLIIRTSGEKRTSGLMPFQGAYAELYFAEEHFPDFDACSLRAAVEDFSKRKRNFGR